MAFSLGHLACLFGSSRPLLPALLLLPSTHLLMDLQLLHEIIQDLLGRHGGHIYNILLQKCHRYPSPPAPAVTTHMGLLEVRWAVGVFSAQGRLLLASGIDRLWSVSITGRHFVSASCWTVVQLMLDWQTGFSSCFWQPLFERHEGCDLVQTCLRFCWPIACRFSNFRSRGLAVRMCRTIQAADWSRAGQKLLYGLSWVKVLLQKVLYQAGNLELRSQTTTTLKTVKNTDKTSLGFMCLMNLLWIFVLPSFITLC